MTTFARRAEVFGWLVELERLDTSPERQAALRNGWELVQLAIREERVSSEQSDTLARFVAELEGDRWIAWDYQPWSNGANAPTSRGFSTQHLQRCDRIRITPEGYAAWAARPDTALSDRVEPAPAGEPTRDVFLCHAGEDKDEVARPLAEALVARGYDVWFDEYELAIGDSLRRSIDQGLARSRFGLVVLSPSFFNKGWPQRELDGLTARETGDDLVILPIWHQVDEEEVRWFSPPLADRLAARSEEGSDALAERVAHAINRRRGLARSPFGPSTTPRPGLTQPPDDVHDLVLDALRRNDTVGLRELMREERRAFRATLRDEPLTRVHERPTEASIRALGADLETALERRLLGLMLLIDYDTDQFNRELEDFARLLDERPAVDGYVFWLQLLEWAAWWLTHALGAHALREWAPATTRTLLSTTYDDGNKRRPLADGGAPDVGRDIAKLVLVPPEGSSPGWIAPEWEMLVRSLSNSRRLRELYPEMADAETVRGALGSWDFVLCLALGLRGKRSLGYWDIGGPATPRFARRLRQDDSLRERLASEMLEVPLHDLDTRASGALSRSQTMSSGAAAEALIGEE